MLASGLFVSGRRDRASTSGGLDGTRKRTGGALHKR